jgi:hypothetical protein
MTTSLTIVDAEATVRNWARAETHIVAQVGTKVYFSMPIAFPKAALATLTPWIVMTLVSETFQAGDLGMQLSLVQFDCYGPTKANASSVATSVETAARLLSFGAPLSVTIPSGSAQIAWADVDLKRWFVDPTLNIPRYIVDVRFAIHGPEA